MPVPMRMRGVPSDLTDRSSSIAAVGDEHKRPMKQEQEDARPGFTELAPNVLRMQLPISMPGLGHVNMYALVDDRGVASSIPGSRAPRRGRRSRTACATPTSR